PPFRKPATKAPNWNAVGSNPAPAFTPPTAAPPLPASHGSASSSPASAPGPAETIGVRVLVQQWTPVSPNQQSVQALVDDPGVTSTALASGWAKARPSICNALVNAIDQSSLAG